MKAKLFFLLFFITYTHFSVSFADNYSNIDMEKNSEYDKKEEVLLSGTLGTGMIKSLTIIPFEVWKSSSTIEISYLSNLTDIDIEIKNELGQSFHYSKVNPVSGGQLIIDIQGWAEGNYVITFSNGKGGCVYGAFTIL